MTSGIGSVFSKAKKLFSNGIWLINIKTEKRNFGKISPALKQTPPRIFPINMTGKKKKKEKKSTHAIPD